MFFQQQQQKSLSSIPQSQNYIVKGWINMLYLNTRMYVNSKGNCNYKFYLTLLVLSLAHAKNALVS